MTHLHSDPLMTHFQYNSPWAQNSMMFLLANKIFKALGNFAKSLAKLEGTHIHLSGRIPGLNVDSCLRNVAVEV